MKTGTLVAFFFLWCTIPVMGQRIDTVWVDSIPIEMVFVEGGSFVQGCDTKDTSIHCPQTSTPAHKVVLNDFYIAKYELTRELYSAIMGKDPSICSFEHPRRLCPVENVSWYDAQAFIDTLNARTGMHFRLPTEAEWEYAARGGKYHSPFRFAGSHNINDVGWRVETDPKVRGQVCQWTKPVGQKQPNALGLYDMTCNVKEWCSDWFSSEYYSLQNSFKNPKGPAQGDEKVCRGGSWGEGDIKNCWVSTRSKSNPERHSPCIGFRLAIDAEDVKR